MVASKSRRDKSIQMNLIILIVLVCNLDVSLCAQCPSGNCMPAKWHCNSHERFCIFCDGTQSLQTIHDSLTDSYGFTFYISPIQFNCKGLRDGAFLETTQLNLLNFSTLLPIYWIDSSLFITKPGLIIRSLFPGIPVQFPIDLYTTPIFAVNAEDCIISDMIGVRQSNTSIGWGVPLVFTFSSNLTIQSASSPLLLQAVTDSDIVVNISQSSGSIILMSPTRQGSFEVIVDSPHTIVSFLPSEFVLIVNSSVVDFIDMVGGIFDLIKVDCVKECDTTEPQLSLISYILIGVAGFAIIVCLIHFIFSSHIVHDYNKKDD